MKDEFGDRMKAYENAEAARRFAPLLPVCARLDGKAFSRFTRDLQRPFDARLSELMRLTTDHLVRETQANIGYTQSDEISLAWHTDNAEVQIFFDGRVQKMNSVLAAMATAFFNQNLAAHLPEKAGAMPIDAA